MLFILRYFFDLVIFIYIMSICVCVNRTIDVDLRMVLDGAVFMQTGIPVSCIQHIIQVYLKKNTIRIIITRIPYFLE